ncbi:MAG: anaerobic ribonucleoside-triphosphate reductase activating protein [Spirochaetaceae bacterium 4572_7]|nr:MAG: anaerobic ribonucleoside-triphosphate reductase activating protein [Spirochaetaceae bacterium 4572_7]
MNITVAGFMATTLLDYPGEVASVIFLPWCNLRCPYCHNPSIVNPEENSLDSIELIIETIEKRKNLITSVVITGGEPTLYDDLQKYIDLFHSWGLKVKVDTNGTRPEVVKSITPNYIAMDLKTSLKKYVALGYSESTDNIEESLNWIKNSGIEYEIRTTAAPLIFTKEDLIEMLPILKGVKNYIITNFRNGETLNPEYNNNVPYRDDEIKDFVTIAKDAGLPCTLR